MNTNQPTTRRGFLDLLLALCSAVAGVAMAIPGLMYLWPAARGSGGENVELEGADSMAVGQSAMLQVGGKAVIVVRQRSGFKAFSAVCTHLGCLVRWDQSQKVFVCPCHAAKFDAAGKVVSGPPPAPMPVYAVKDVDGKIYIVSSQS